MITRRNALRLGASAGVALSTFRTAGAQVATPVPNAKVEGGPSLDAPIVIKWTYETGYGPVIVDGVAYGTTPETAVWAIDAETGLELWRTSMPVNYFRPIVANGTLYAGLTASGLVAIDAGTGVERWRFEVGKDTRPPLVTDDTVYVGVSEGAFYALDLQTGNEKWRFNSLDIESHIQLRPQISADTLFVTAGMPVLYAIEPATGAEKWSFRTDGYAPSSPILDSGNIYMMDSSGIFALTQETGEELWRVPVSSSNSVAPKLVENTIYASSYDGPMYAIDTNQGTIIWELESPESGYGADQMHIYDDVLVYHEATGGQMFPYYNLIGINRFTGDTIWRTEDNWNSMSWGPGSEGTIVVSENHHKADGGDFPIYSIDIATGREIWRTIQPGGFSGTPVAGAGNLYVTTEFGTIYCFGNLKPAKLVTDTVVRGAPSATGIERGTAPAGAEIASVGARDSRTGEEWIEVTIGDLTGWIPAEAIDPATLPPEGEIEYVYVP